MTVEEGTPGRADRAFTNGRIEAVAADPDIGQRLVHVEASVQHLAAADQHLRHELTELRGRMLSLLQQLHTQLAPLPASTGHAGSDGYRDLVHRVRAAVHDVVPLDATVAVVSRGDDQLLDFFGRQGWHFPQDGDGRWLGYHPKNSLAAVAHLEALRALGADHLVIPSSSYWWFETYADLGRRLTSCHQELPADTDTCRIFSLHTRLDRRSAVQQFVERELAWRGALDVLDLTKAGDIAGVMAGASVFRPLGGGLTGYADQSIPMVAIDSDAPDVRSEAKRLATVAVLDLARDEVRAIESRQTTPPSVSVIMPVFNKASLTAAALASLTATLPVGFRGEVIVVDDGSSDEARLLLEEWPSTNSLVRVLRNPVNRGYLPSLVRGIEAASGDYLLLVNNDMVFLDGWLEPLLRTFDDFADAGAVGGRLLYPDGRLQEAGGILFADGSAAKFGYGDADNGRAAYSFVRPVDYCSGCLLLTPRALFNEVGGVDRTFDPGYYEDTDYCLRLRLAGHGIYYQPESVVVHIEGGTAGMDMATGMKRYQDLNHRRFVEKWGETLRGLQPARPDPCDDAALHGLVLRQRPAIGVGR